MISGDKFAFDGSDNPAIDSEGTVVNIGEGPCILSSRFTVGGSEIVERFDPKKLTLYQKIRKLETYSFHEGYDIVLKSVVNELRDILLKILENGYLNDSSAAGKVYHKELSRFVLQNENLAQIFLITKIHWIYKRLLSKIGKGNMGELKAQLFYLYLEEELVHLIKYLEEFIFIQEHRDASNFEAVVNKYKPIILWGANRYGSVMKKNEREDLIQELTLVLWKCIQKWSFYPNQINHNSRSNSLGFSAYLKAAIRNRCGDIWRGNNAEKRKSLGLTIGSMDEGSDSYIGSLVQTQIVRQYLEDIVSMEIEEFTPQ